MKIYNLYENRIQNERKFDHNIRSVETSNSFIAIDCSDKTFILNDKLEVVFNSGVVLSNRDYRLYGTADKLLVYWSHSTSKVCDWEFSNGSSYHQNIIQMIIETFKFDAVYHIAFKFGKYIFSAKSGNEFFIFIFQQIEYKLIINNKIKLSGPEEKIKFDSKNSIVTFDVKEQVLRYFDLNGDLIQEIGDPKIQINHILNS